MLTIVSGFTYVLQSVVNQATSLGLQQSGPSLPSKYARMIAFLTCGTRGETRLSAHAQPALSALHSLRFLQVRPQLVRTRLRKWSRGTRELTVRDYWGASVGWCLRPVPKPG